MLMKKAILTLLVSVGVIVATATIYPYLNVGLNNGTEVSYPATDLTLKFENGKIVATNGTQQTGSTSLASALYMVFGLGNDGEGGGGGVFGDVNCDGVVTSSDITAIYNYLLSGDETFLATSDLNGDGNVTSSDVTLLYNVLLNGDSGNTSGGTATVGEITEGDQTMWVVTGDVKWAFTTAQLDTISYTGGTAFTAQGKTFNIADVDEIYVDNTPVADNTVDVAYNGNTAQVIVAGNIAKNMTASVNGAHVVALQDANVADEITYTLAGSSTNGSFYQDGSLKITVRLNGVTLNNPDSAAINIRDGKRIAVELVEGTTSNLTDGTGGSQKGCFAVKGHTEFKGAGILNITGNSSHAFWGKEYVEIKKTVGEINILGSKGDGFNINQYYLQNGGKVTVKNVADDGIQVSQETDDNDVVVEEEENTGEVTLKDGTIDMTISSAGGKGIKAATNFIMLKGTLKMVQSGNLVAGDGDIDYGTCVKAGGDILIHGGSATDKAALPRRVALAVARPLVPTGSMSLNLLVAVILAAVAAMRGPTPACTSTTATEPWWLISPTTPFKRLRVIIHSRSTTTTLARQQAAPIILRVTTTLATTAPPMLSSRQPSMVPPVAATSIIRLAAAIQHQAALALSLSAMLPRNMEAQATSARTLAQAITSTFQKAREAHGTWPTALPTPTR